MIKLWDFKIIRSSLILSPYIEKLLTFNFSDMIIPNFDILSTTDWEKNAKKRLWYSHFPGNVIVMSGLDSEDLIAAIMEIVKYLSVSLHRAFHYNLLRRDRIFYLN